MITLKGRWTQNLVYKAILDGFNSTSLKAIKKNSNGNVYLISGLNKFNIKLKPKNGDTLFSIDMTMPFGWSPLGWCLIIPSALLIGYNYIGIIPVAILWIASYIQDSKFKKELYPFLKTVDIDNVKNEMVKKTKSEVSLKHINQENDIFKQIEKVGQLYEKGYITEEEFIAKKKQLLDKF